MSNARISWFDLVHELRKLQLNRALLAIPYNSLLLVTTYMLVYIYIYISVCVCVIILYFYTRSSVSMTLCVGTFPSGSDVINNEPLGGSSTIVIRVSSALLKLTGTPTWIAFFKIKYSFFCLVIYIVGLLYPLKKNSDTFTLWKILNHSQTMLKALRIV